MAWREDFQLGGQGGQVFEGEVQAGGKHLDAGRVDVCFGVHAVDLRLAAARCADAAARAIAAATLLFFQNLIGLGLGPLFFGILSDFIKPMAGPDSVRYVLYGAALMGLVFLSSGTGHDESIDDALDPDAP